MGTMELSLYQSTRLTESSGSGGWRLHWSVARPPRTALITGGLELELASPSAPGGRLEGFEWRRPRWRRRLRRRRLGSVLAEGFPAVSLYLGKGLAGGLQVRLVCVARLLGEGGLAPLESMFNAGDKQLEICN